MKNACIVAKSALICFGTILVLPSLSQADWVTDFVDRATVTTTQASSFESNGRHYATGGGASVRWASSVDYPISINPPRLSGGCGGIDAYLGGVSFLDEEYLVQKIEAIITNAPAIAFDIAMKQMSSQLSETYKSFESIANSLNSLQVDDCGIAKAGFVTVKEDVTAGAAKMWETAKVGFKTAFDGSAKNADAAKSTMNDQDIEMMLSACLTDARYSQFMGESGSLLEKSATILNLIHADKTDMLRANFGDVSMTYDESSGRAVGAGVFTYVSGQCGATSKGLGAAYSRYVDEGIYTEKGAASGSACVDVPDNEIRSLLQSAMTKFLASPQGSLTQQERNVVYMTGIPLDLALKSAELDGSLGVLQDNILTALPLMYSYNMFRQEIGEYTSMLVRLKQYLVEALGGTNAFQCPNEPVELLLIEINKAEKAIQNQHRDLQAEYRSKLNDNGIDPLLLRQQIQELIDKAVAHKHRMLQSGSR